MTCPLGTTTCWHEALPNVRCQEFRGRLSDPHNLCFCIRRNIMNMRRYEPWSLLNQLSNEMNTLFDQQTRGDNSAMATSD